MDAAKLQMGQAGHQTGRLQSAAVFIAEAKFAVQIPGGDKLMGVGIHSRLDPQGHLDGLA